MKALRVFLFYLLVVACTAPSSEAQTVYITKTGKKYHRESCQYLRKSQYPIAMKEAINRGYTACSVCSPGGLSKEKTSQSPAPNQDQKTPAKTQENDTVKSRQCTATTKAGTRCKRMTTSTSGKCYQHE